MNPNIFREYDIRGRVPEDLNKDTVYELGRAMGAYFVKNGIKRISLGRDCRLSSSEIRDILADALTRSGVDIIDIGLVPTPVLYFSLFNLEVQGGVQITASHNPPEYNGFKVCVGKTTIYGEEIQKIRKIGEEGSFVEGQGSYETEDIVSTYISYVVENMRLGKNRVKVVVDGGNGVGGQVAIEIYKRMGIEVVDLFCNPDGRFPNHHPDPTVVENLKYLISKVKELNADLGIGFDGDADRIGVIDSSGEIIWGDQLMIIFSRDLLEERPQSKIIAEVKCSQVLFDDIKRHNGIPIMWKVGHSLIKSKMKEEGALLAGEMSGHMFFNDRYYGYDDAIYAGARLLEILTRKEKDIREHLKDIPKMVNTPEIRIDCPDEIKFNLVKELAEEFKKDYEVIDIDGARVLFRDGWGLVRASNTQPVLVLRFEAESEDALERIKRLFMDKIERRLSK